MQRVVLSLLCALPLVSSGCGRVPKATTTRESGQSGLMDESFAAKNKCNPKNALRPFIIEWDGTDMSSFESVASSDLVVVRYEGCDLQVLDECRNDSIRGSQGAYKPVEWTTGSLEKLQIANQGELYAKLPLGSASLGGRVAGGEKFTMEYYVAGTRNATRAAVYRADIETNPGCEGATHFVYGYNLGAFALGTTQNFSADVGVSAFGFGAGGKTSSNSQADKKGGDLGVCKSDSAAEVSGCKAPIRLTLRPIREGENPDKEAMTAADTDASLNAAGQVNAKIQAGEAANAYINAAIQKMNVKDGKGCLGELDSFDKVNPKAKTTDPKSPFALYRGQCLMLSGKCDPGRALYRKAYEQMSPSTSPEQVDDMTSTIAIDHCQGGLTPREDLIKASRALMIFGNSGAKPTVKECNALHGKIVTLHPKVKPKDDEDREITSMDLVNVHGFWTQCLSRAGECKQAYKLYLEGSADVAQLKTMDEPARQAYFGSRHPKCKGKPVQ